MPEPVIRRIDLDSPTPTQPLAQSRLASAPSTNPVVSNPIMPNKRFSARTKKTLAVIGGVLLILIVLIGGLGFYTWQIAKTLKVQADEAQVLGHQAYDSFKGQNLPATQQSLQQLQTKVTDMQGTYSKLAFYKAIPIANNYYADGTHGLNAAAAGISAGLKSVDAVTPYADVLGFTGAAKFTGGTAEDRLKILLETLDKISPQLDTISSDLQVTKSELSQIDPKRYPENFQGKPLRSYIVQAQAGVDGAVTALTDYRPVLEQLPAMAGAKDRQKYLVLFQNDNELRPTGGFLTAYSIINIDNGKVEPETSDDIYSLDQKFKSKIPIPEALGRYLTTEKYWNLRDMNTSPDFKTSMDQFLKYYKTLPGVAQNLNGVIAVDTRLLTDLLKILGPVDVPGYGTFSAENDQRCDCPQVVYALSEIITRPTPYLRPDRKGILGPMMRGILNKAYTAPKDMWSNMVQTGLADLAQRHIQVYMFDDKSQSAMATVNATGQMKPVANSDFLGIIDANLGGAKSNLFIDYEVMQTVSAPKDGKITKTVEITYKNHRHGDNCNLEAGLLCLNSTLRDWSRLYLPAGAQLVEAQGYTATPKTYEEAGFEVFDGFFLLEPNSQAKLRVTYTVPYTDPKQYRIQLWKQGGIESIKEIFDVNGSQDVVTVDQDKSVEIDF